MKGARDARPAPALAKTRLERGTHISYSVGREPAHVSILEHDLQSNSAREDPALEEVPMVVCAMAGRWGGGSLVGGCADAGGGALDRSSDNRGADRETVAGT